MAVGVLFSWIGEQDPWRRAAGRPTGSLGAMPRERPPDWVEGPILSFLAHSTPFDCLYLLSTPRMVESGALDALTGALRERYQETLKLEARVAPIDDPRLYDDIYRHARAVCEEGRRSHGERQTYHVLVSPGTPQMHAIWLLLTKTVVPAAVWQTSDMPGRSKAELARIPFDLEAELIEPAIEAARVRPAALPSTEGLIYNTPAVRRMLSTAGIAATSEAPVLLIGEASVGKKVVARLIHEYGPRRNYPFVAVNCGAIPPALLQSELFGALQEAAPLGQRERRGLCEAAQGGTLFLDEVGTLDLACQLRLLKLLQEHTIQRDGDPRKVSINARIIAANREPLHSLIQAGSFRQDLYYQLAVVPIQVPPLRERREDLALLIEHHLDAANEERKRQDRPPLHLSPTARRRLLEYHWPGNLHELDNVMSRLGVLVDGNVIRPGHIDQHLVPSLGNPSIAQGTLKEAVHDYECRLIDEAIRVHGTLEKAAVALGVGGEPALSRLMKKLGMASRRLERKRRK